MPERHRIKDLKAKIEALIIAIPRELEAYEYYMDMAERYEDEASREMFVFLAKQELSHRDVLERILSDLQRELVELTG